jgi:hypothetical protein
MTTTPLTITECRAMASRMKEMDKALFISLLLCGARARSWTWTSAMQQIVTMPEAVYQSLRELATDHQLMTVPYNFARYANAHWLGIVDLKTPIFTSEKSNGKPWTTQEVTRRLSRYGRMIGLQQVSLRVVANTHKSLQAAFSSMDEAAEQLGFCPPPIAILARVQARTHGQEVKDTRLHGIGRRPRTRAMSLR